MRALGDGIEQNN